MLLHIIDHCSFHLQDSNPVPSQKSWKTNEADGEWTLLPQYHSLHASVSVSTEFKHLSEWIITNIHMYLSSDRYNQIAYHYISTELK